MPWARIDDTFYLHPKVVGLPLPAVGLWVTALSYCAKYLTDGFIPTEAVVFLAAQAGTKREDALSYAQELVRVRLWRPNRQPNGFRFHDYRKYNPSKALVEAERAANAIRQRKWYRGKKTANLPNPNADPNAVRKGVTNADPNADPNATPVPVPVPVVRKLGVGDRSTTVAGDPPRSKVAHAPGTGEEEEHARHKQLALQRYHAALEGRV